jgi:hypothetical protein
MQDRVVPEKRGKNDDETLANFIKQSTQQRRKGRNKERGPKRERTQVGARRAKPKAKKAR